MRHDFMSAWTARAVLAATEVEEAEEALVPLLLWPGITGGLHQIDVARDVAGCSAGGRHHNIDDEERLHRT